MRDKTRNLSPEAREKYIDKLEASWRKARDISNRREADRLSRQLLQILADDDYRADTHRTYLCDSLLYRGELDEAAANYRKLVPRGQLQETAAYAGLARIAAERRDFAQGIQWLERYKKAPGAMCGNCFEWRRYHGHVLRTVWHAAGQSTPEAALRHVVAGQGYTPIQMRLKRIPDSMQKESAAQEARFILAEHLARQRRIPAAKALFRELINE